MIPGLLTDCESIETDLSSLLQMAAIFEHPLTLIFHIGKSLIVNGCDIFTKIETAVQAYKKGEYFEFGSNIGMALDEVFLKAFMSNNGT